MSDPVRLIVEGFSCILDEDAIAEFNRVGGRFHVDRYGYLMHRQSLVHRILAGNKSRGMHVDHINRNRLDNRLSNLQIIDERTHLKKTRLESAVGYTKRTSGYEVDVSWDGKRKYVGTFATPKLARAAWCGHHLEHNSQWLDDVGMYDWMLVQQLEAQWGTYEEVSMS